MTDRETEDVIVQRTNRLDLESIRQRMDEFFNDGAIRQYEDGRWAQQYRADIDALLAEVERLTPMQTDLRLARDIDEARNALAQENERLRTEIERLTMISGETIEAIVAKVQELDDLSFRHGPRISRLSFHEIRSAVVAALTSPR